MTEPSQIPEIIPSALVAELFEAAVEDTGLGRIAELIGQFVGVEGSAILLVRGSAPPETYSSKVISEQAHLYGAYYHKLDPWRARGLVLGRDRVVLSNELYPESELIKTEFYTDFARPMGMFRPMSAYLDLGGGEMAALGVEQPFAKRLFDYEDKRRLEAFIPTVKRALQLRIRSKTAGLKATVGMSALDALPLAVIICDPVGHVVHANPFADAFARNGQLVVERNNILGATTGDDTVRILALVESAAGGAGGSMRLVASNGQRVVLLATPIPPDISVGVTTRVMVTVRAESGVPTPSVAILRSVYGMSAVQADLCVSLASGRTAEECASSRDVKVSTVRSHLAAVLARTGTQNLRDLLRLLGAISGGMTD